MLSLVRVFAISPSEKMPLHVSACYSFTIEERATMIDAAARGASCSTRIRLHRKTYEKCDEICKNHKLAP